MVEYSFTNYVGIAYQMEEKYDVFGIHLLKGESSNEEDKMKMEKKRDL